MQPIQETAWFEAGLQAIGECRWFEAHEILEEGWRALPKEDSRRSGVQGLIQLSVSLEHWRRGNPRGARGQWEKGSNRLKSWRVFEGVDVERLLKMVERHYQREGIL
jgi:predicted metal-dependent hydrolase